MNAFLVQSMKSKAVFVATVLDGAVLLERVRIEAAALDGERMIHHELRRHDRVDQRRIAALGGNRIAQAGEVDERGLAENVVAHDARRKPREIQVALALDDLPERRGKRGRRAAAHEVLGEHARGVRQLVVGAGLDGDSIAARVSKKSSFVPGRGLRFAVFIPWGRNSNDRGIVAGRPEFNYPPFPVSASRAARTAGLRDRCSLRSGE